MAKRVLTERDILEAKRKGLSSLAADPSTTVVTPAARDAATLHRIELLNQPADAIVVPSSVEGIQVIKPAQSRNPNAAIIIALGSDHGGFALKETIKKFLLDGGYTVADVGTNNESPCDYPDFSFAVASLISSGQASKGIMVDAVGVASAMVANKIPGVRAAVGFSEFAARSSREHNDANMLTLGGKVTGSEAAKAIVNVWLETWFGGGRHAGRVKKISDIEKRFLK